MDKDQWEPFGSERPLEDRTVSILDRHLSGDFRVFPMAEGTSSIEEVRAAGDRLGVKLPSELIAHLSGRFPGIHIEAKEEIWRRPRSMEVGPFWSFLYGLHTYTASTSSEDWMRLEAVSTEFRESTGLSAIPVLKVIGDADLYCLDAEARLVRFNHELNELEPIDLSFFDLFEREVAELCERTARKKAQKKGSRGQG